MAIRKLNKTKILKALEATDKYIKEAEARGAKETFKTTGGGFGFTILWCEKRNRNQYQEMLRYDYLIELYPDLRELYKAI